MLERKVELPEIFTDSLSTLLDQIFLEEQYCKLRMAFSFLYDNLTAISCKYQNNNNNNNNNNLIHIKRKLSCKHDQICFTYTYEN